jgi:hypothetical protein
MLMMLLLLIQAASLLHVAAGQDSKCFLQLLLLCDGLVRGRLLLLILAATWLRFAAG